MIPERVIPRDLLPRDTAIITGGVEPPRLVTFEKWVFPPSDHVPFDLVDVRTVPAGTTVEYEVIASDFARGVVRWFGNEVTTATDYAFIRWTLLANGNPIVPVIDAIESRGLINDPDPLVIHLRSNTTLSVRIENTGVAAVVGVKTRLKGWLY